MWIHLLLIKYINKRCVDNTNKTEEKLKKAREGNNFENIKCLERDLSFYGSGAILHKQFFENMGPALPTSPDVNLMEQIIKDFGSYEKYINAFWNIVNWNVVNKRYNI